MIWVTFAQIANAITLGVILALNSRTIGDAGVGQLSMSLTIVLLINQMIFVGANASVNRFYHNQRQKMVKSFLEGTGAITYATIKKRGIIILIGLTLIYGVANIGPLLYSLGIL